MSLRYSSILRNRAGSEKFTKNQRKLTHRRRIGLVFPSRCYFAPLDKWQNVGETPTLRPLIGYAGYGSIDIISPYVHDQIPT